MLIGRKIQLGTSVPKMMLWVILALLPALLVQTIYFGWGVLLNVIVASLGAASAEAACHYLRRRKPLYELGDLSALVSALLLGLSLPPQLPLELTFTGAVFMMVLGKHIFGGLGANPFNPAMLAYAMLLLSFPLRMTSWLPPLALEYLSDIQLLQAKIGLLDIDGYTAATALDNFRAHDNFSLWLQEWQQGFRPFILLSLLYACGGLILLYKKIISWHIPFSMLAGLLLPAVFFYLINDDLFPPPWFHLILGASIFGAFFIATDPVSAATSKPARLVYGFGIGLFIFIIRSWGSYADAVAFGVLFFNFAAPFLDKYIKPRIYGH